MAVVVDVLKLTQVEGVVCVQNNAQFAFVRISDVPSIQQVDMHDISGAASTIVEMMQDGEGMIDVRLST